MRVASATSFATLLRESPSLPAPTAQGSNLSANSSSIHILRVTARAFKTICAIRCGNYPIRHSFHHDEVDVSQLVVSGSDGLRWPHARGNMAMHVKTQFVRLCRCGGHPRGIQGAVELDAGEAIGFGFLRRFNREAYDLSCKQHE